MVYPWLVCLVGGPILPIITNSFVPTLRDTINLIALFAHFMSRMATTPWKHILEAHPTTSFATALRDCHAALISAYDTASTPVTSETTSTIPVVVLLLSLKINYRIYKHS